MFMIITLVGSLLCALTALIAPLLPLPPQTLDLAQVFGWFFVILGLIGISLDEKKHKK